MAARNTYPLDEIENGSRAFSRRSDDPHTPAIHADSHAHHHHHHHNMRDGFNPFTAVKIMMKHSNIVSSWVNVLLPVVPIALAVHWARPDWNLAIFALNYIAMIPSANLLSFCSNELALKFPRVFGIIVEVTLGAAVEIIICMILLFQHKAVEEGVSHEEETDKQFETIKGVIVGSMLANLLLCTGLCFIVGGLRYSHSKFNEAVTETAGGMMLIAVAALALPLAFKMSIDSTLYNITEEDLMGRVVHVSRITAICLLIACFTYLFFQLKTHHSYFDEMLDQAEKRDKDAHLDEQRKKLTITEAVVFTCLSLTLVTLHAFFMVQEISWVVEERGISDAFIGLILVPVVEKAAEHLSAIDEAWDDAMDFALTHIFGATLHTALLVAPLTVIVAWIAGKEFGLDFEAYQVVVLILAVLIIGNFIKDNKSNYLEGVLCVLFYIIIAAGTYYYPNPDQKSIFQLGEGSTEGSLESNATSVLPSAHGE